MIKSIFLIFQMLFASSGIADLNGRWQATKAEMAGAVWPEAVTKTILLTLNNGKYELGPDSGDVIIIDNQKMEIKGTEGPNKGKTYKAIYELKGDELMICYDLSGSSFPSSFASKPETKLFLVHYSRVKN